MKNSVLTALFVLTSWQVFAQITITESNLFVPGDRYIHGVGLAGLDSSILPGSSGPMQSWNFTTSAFDYFDTVDVYAPGWVDPAHSAACPQATHVLAYGTTGMSFDLMLVDQTGVYILGNSFVSPTFGVQTSTYLDYVDWMRFPATYGQNYIDTAYFDNTVAVSNGSIDSTRSIATITFNSNIDAWGTMTIGASSFDAVRVTRVLSYFIVSMAHDSVTGWQPPSSTTLNLTMHEWWTDSSGIGYPIATLYMDQMGAVQQYNILQVVTTDIAEQNSPEDLFSIYPSPAFATIQLSTQSMGGNWQIIDIAGRIVLTGNVSSTLTQIDVGELPSGIYSMIFEDESGSSTARKFVKE